MIDEAALLAQGWERLPTVRYSAAVGPTWKRLADGELEVGLIAEAHLGNDNLGIVHGGAMMTFGDMALGCGVGHAQANQMFVTAQLQFHFVSAARVGDFIVCRPHVVKATSQLVFVRGLFEADGRTLATADGIFKLLDPAKAQGMKAK